MCNFVFELHLGRYLGGHKPQTDLSFGILTEDIPELALNLLFAPFLVLEDRAPTIDLDISHAVIWQGPKCPCELRPQLRDVSF